MRQNCGIERKNLPQQITSRKVRESAGVGAQAMISQPLRQVVRSRVLGYDNRSLFFHFIVLRRHDTLINLAKAVCWGNISDSDRCDSEGHHRIEISWNVNRRCWQNRWNVALDAVEKIKSIKIFSNFIMISKLTVPDCSSRWMTIPNSRSKCRLRWCNRSCVDICPARLRDVFECVLCLACAFDRRLLTWKPKSSTFNWVSKCQSIKFLP